MNWYFYVAVSIDTGEQVSGTFTAVDSTAYFRAKTKAASELGHGRLLVTQLNLL